MNKPVAIEQEMEREGTKRNWRSRNEIRNYDTMQKKKKHHSVPAIDWLSSKRSGVTHYSTCEPDW